MGVWEKPKRSLYKKKETAIPVAASKTKAKINFNFGGKSEIVVDTNAKEDIQVRKVHLLNSAPIVNNGYPYRFHFTQYFFYSTVPTTPTATTTPTIPTISATPQDEEADPDIAAAEKAAFLADYGKFQRFVRDYSV